MNDLSMKSANARILTVNAGSSSIKFALFELDDGIERVVSGAIERIGLPDPVLKVTGEQAEDNVSRAVAAADHTAAVKALMTWLEERGKSDTLAAVGHRVVHSGSANVDPQRITADLLEALRELSPFFPDHLPGEIRLIKAFRRLHPKLVQVACFDTAFHHDLPRVARMLPLPRRYEAQGMRRYGFHGLSYAYLMEELTRVAGTQAAKGRVILAHLGNGASMTAVHDGKSVDTSMGFTPTAGLVMSTRTGDLDPGLAWHLMRGKGLTPRQFNQMINHESGLLGVSETSSDMRDLFAREASDVRAAEAIELFCYQAKKFVGAYAAVLGEVDTLIFAGGIGENVPEVRARICNGLQFLGIEVDEKRNAANAAVISGPDSRVTVRVIHTDEEVMIAKSTCTVLGFQGASLPVRQD
ncbi:MAG: acetate/propionate family kinase [Burkholderiales bacterium]